MIKVTDLVQTIEKQLSVGESTDHSLSVTGEPYVTIGSQHPDYGLPCIPGTVDEKACAELAFDEETAVMAAYANFLSYAEDRYRKLASTITANGSEADFDKTCEIVGKCKIYWRMRPRLEWNEDKTRCQVYMRLLISAVQ